MLVVGYGVYTHIFYPIPRRTRSAISTFLEDTLITNLNARGLDMSRCLTQRFGFNTSYASVRKVFNKLRRTCVGYGNSAKEVIRE